MSNSTSKSPVDFEFEQFRAVYPRWRGCSRAAARQAYERARRVATFETIMRGLADYPFHADPQFQPHPATWLNQRRWEIEDDHAAPTVIAEAGRTAWMAQYDQAPAQMTLDGIQGDD